MMLYVADMENVTTMMMMMIMTTEFAPATKDGTVPSVATTLLRSHAGIYHKLTLKCAMDTEFARMTTFAPAITSTQDRNARP